jgi:hypothetical protein
VDMIATLGKSRQALAGAVLLLVLLFRAAVPVGFMPSGDGPFALKICPDGLPNAHAHLHHGDGHGHFESCPFGSVPAAGPISHDLGVAALPVAAGELFSEFFVSIRAIRLSRAHAARAPPSLLN